MDITNKSDVMKELEELNNNFNNDLIGGRTFLIMPRSEMNLLSSPLREKYIRMYGIACQVAIIPLEQTASKYEAVPDGSNKSIVDRLDVLINIFTKRGMTPFQIENIKRIVLITIDKQIPLEQEKNGISIHN